PGDLLVATGAFGGSLLGRHLAMRPRVREALSIAERFPVHAAIDCSDGLSLDLARMMAASGTRGVVRLADIPIHPDAVRRAERDGGTPLEHALGDGEDFELILALPPDAARGLVAAAGTPPLDLPITVIGSVEEGAGLVAEAADGSRSPLAPRGFVHDFDS
ncbi:MAG: thiamine-phosphate kinase, partial [Planctomycetia bacterium]